MIVRGLLQSDELVLNNFGNCTVWNLVHKVELCIEGYIDLVRIGSNTKIDNDPDLGLIHPLFLVASRCRDPVILRYALRLL